MEYVNELLTFIKKSPTSFHGVNTIKEILLNEGFICLNENEKFNLKEGNNYFVTRNDSSIIAFKLNKKNYSFSIVASHLDSPAFKVKTNAEIINGGYLNLDVEPYGGMILNSWFDRPLSLAGRVFVKSKDGIETKLIDFNKNLLSIPSTAIHLNPELNRGYTFNKAVDFNPTISLDINLKLNDLISNKINCNKNDIISYDLFLISNQDGYVWGADDEFVSSTKLDDLACVYSSLKSFIESKSNNISIFASFDNEEVGSLTKQGADSTFLEDTLKRISLSLNKNEEEHKIALSNSFLVSADNGHAIHPTHPELFDKINGCMLNKGIVIKFNANQKYCSDALSYSIFKSILDDANVLNQVYSNRSDLPGGSTLGNISNNHVSLKSIDIGFASLAMHSINETIGSKDIKYMVEGLKAFYNASISFENNKILFK